MLLSEDLGILIQVNYIQFVGFLFCRVFMDELIQRNCMDFRLDWI